ncbi:hypothetical protein IE81DRAFT_202693 [Ceraceosorus guamensis]|uniref:Uncharacterized protein n=1 Tax=Ceraceosorus guamensis TaxID=1522189 RepID=A0A316VV65_9BASI|nr:hypothetical protein IE81DRAFT_202693 [Ceraceosorus guamensis]PWN40818.1 hypothetical protein IE81DRAFT_202693 [Ceraceosorus guamensis]
MPLPAIARYFLSCSSTFVGPTNGSSFTPDTFCTSSDRLVDLYVKLTTWRGCGVEFQCLITLRPCLVMLNVGGMRNGKGRMLDSDDCFACSSACWMEFESWAGRVVRI